MNTKKKQMFLLSMMFALSIIVIGCGIVDVSQEKNKASQTAFVESGYTYPPNAKIVGDWSYVRNANGTKIPGKRVDIGDMITVMDVSLSKNLALVEYPTSKGIEKGYYITAANNISYINPGNWKNGSTIENVYAEDGTTIIAKLDPLQTATLLYSKKINGKDAYHVVFNYNGRTNNMSGYVYYSGVIGNYCKPVNNFYTCSINGTLHGRSVYRWANVSGHNVFKGYTEWEKNNHVGIGDAVDLIGNAGDPVFAICKGKITQINNVGTSTENIWFQWGTNNTAVYAHIKHKTSYKVGDIINAGQIIGTLYPLSSPHLHFELWLNGKAVADSKPAALRELIGKNLQ